MKKNEFAQIKGLGLKELKDKAKMLRGEIADLILDKNMKKLKDLKIVSKKRKERAQVLTIIEQKELLIQLESISSQSSDVSHQTDKETDEKQPKSNERKDKSESRSLKAES